MVEEWRTWIAAALGVLASACGGVMGANDAGAGDASSDQLVDVATSSDGGDAAVLGYMAFENDTTNTSSNTAGFIGSFRADGQPAAPGCTITSFGSCTVYDCGTVDGGAPHPSPGTLTLFGGSLPTSGVPVDASSAYSYSLFSVQAGDVCGVSASGADVPAFGEHTVTMPSMITLTAPQPPFSISTSQDLTVTWSGGEPGARTTFSALLMTGNGTLEAVCYFDASGGSGTVPQAALSPLAKVQGNVTVLWGQLRSTWFSSGSFPLELDGMQYAYGQATLQ